MRRLGSIVFDGSDDENWVLTENLTNVTRFRFNTSSVDHNTPQICSHLLYNNSSTLDSPHFYIYDNKLYIYVPKTVATTVQQLKTWLKLNNITIIYKLANEVIEDIDCSNKIVQYDEQTTVYNRDNAEIEVSLTNNKAISEINKDIDNVENKIRQMSNYSIGKEYVIGSHNGKTAYRRKIRVQSLNDGLLILNIPIDELIDLKGKLIQNNTIHYIIPGPVIGYVQGTGYVVKNVSVSFLDKNSWSPNSIYVITDKTIENVTGYEFTIKYTKTTD